MRQIIQTTQFKCDHKKIAKSGRYYAKDFMDVVNLLVHDKPLSNKYRDHVLTGEWKGYRDAILNLTDF